MRTPIATCVLSALLAGCGTPQERAAYREDPVAAMAPEYGPLCENAGHVPNTTAWRNCIVQSSTRNDLMQQGLFYDRYMQWYRLRF